MESGPRALGNSIHKLRTSGYEMFRDTVKHIPLCKDGSNPMMLGDASSACTP